MNNKSRSFQDYLEERYDMEFTGASDTVEDAYEGWLESLDIDDWMAYGSDYAREEKEILQKDLQDLLGIKNYD